MGASRSRTARWRECLSQIQQRGGGLEIALDQSDGTNAPASNSVVWRVRLYAVDDSALTIEMPGALGTSFPIRNNAKLIAVMAIGQNRWLFRTRVLGQAVTHVGRREFPALRIALPEAVERCPRRRTSRLSTTSLQLPGAQCWMLLDPESAIPAEVANRARINELLRSRTCERPSPELEAVLLPTVGPSASAELANIGGGGVGLRFSRENCIELDTRHYYWLKLDLCPWVPAPLVVTARLAHVHSDASQIVHAGFAFDFSHDAEHRPFIIEQMKRCMRLMQEGRVPCEVDRAA